MNINKAAILARAEKLYKLIVTKKARPELVKRCCNFTSNEEQLSKYCAQYKLDVPIDIPNNTTVAALHEAERITNDPNVKRYTDVEEALRKLKHEP